jgi:hypothetical protein
LNSDVVQRSRARCRAASFMCTTDHIQLMLHNLRASFLNA